MKKLLLSFAVLAASALAASEEDVTFDFTQNSYGQTVVTTGNDALEDNTSFSEGVVTLTVNKLTGNSCRFWKNNSGMTFRVNKASGFTLSVTKGAITAVKFTGTNFNDLSGVVSGAWAGSDASVAFVNKGTSTVQIKTMVVSYDPNGATDTRKDAGLAFAETKVTAVLGQAFTAPELTKATTAAVTFESDNTEVATVNASTGAVTIVALGSARITASAAANDEYKAGSASYLITVKKGAPANSIFWSELGADFTFEAVGEFQAWSHDSSYGLKGSAFKSSKCNASDCYAVSPVIDLTAVETPAIVYSQALNQYKLNNELIAIDDFQGYAYVVVREEGATAWTSLGETTAPAEKFSWDYFDAEPVSLEAYKGKKIQFAFRYVSTDEIAGTWEVKEIAVTGTKSSGIEAVEVENAPVEYFNLQGIRVAEPANGLYIRRQGNTATKVYIR